MSDLFSEVDDRIIHEVILRDKGPTHKVTSWSISALSTASKHFTTLVHQIHVICDNEQKENTTTYIIKSNPIKISDVNDFYTSRVFETEVMMYSKILPQINKILVDLGDTPLKAPKCFYHSTEKHKEFIILEDLSKTGFKEVNIEQGMNETQLEMTLSELAKLHAGSYLLSKRLDSNILENFPFLQTVFFETPKMREVYQARYVKLFNDVISHIEGIVEYSEIVCWLQDTSKNLDNYFDFLYGYDSKFGAICHGDCWLSNFMFLYDSTGQTIDLRIIDYQLCRFGSLVNDISYLLFTSIPEDLRVSKWETYLRFYYNSFTDKLSKCGIKWENQETFLVEYKKKIFFGIMLAFLVPPLQIMTKIRPNTEKEIFQYDIMPIGELEGGVQDALENEKFLSLLDDLRKFVL